MQCAACQCQCPCECLRRASSGCRPLRTTTTQLTTTKPRPTLAQRADETANNAQCDDNIASIFADLTLPHPTRGARSYTYVSTLPGFGRPRCGRALALAQQGPPRSHVPAHDSAPPSACACLPGG
eukprot:scaffold21372_cov129-Isochrysis_galbana.AAC.3